MGILILGDKVSKKRKRKKKKTNNFIIGLLILFLFLFSYFEVNGDIRIGNILNDILFLPTREIKPNRFLDSISNEIEEENEELKGMLKIDYSLTDFYTIYGTVIERNSLFWLNELIINKGSDDGVEEGSAVVNSNGLVGIIESCGLVTSKVRLVTDIKHPISVMINKKHKLLTVEDNKLIIRGINSGDNIKINDVVTTSGLQEKLPKGIVIGTIKKIEYEKNNVGLVAVVDLDANIDNLRFVAVLRRKNQ